MRRHISIFSIYDFRKKNINKIFDKTFYCGSQIKVNFKGQ